MPKSVRITLTMGDGSEHSHVCGLWSGARRGIEAEVYFASTKAAKKVLNEVASKVAV